MAVFLTVALIQLITNSNTSPSQMVLMFVKQLIIGLIAGYVIGKTTVFVMSRLKLEYEGLYPVLTLSIVAFSYSVTSYLGGSGFLAVYLVGLIMGQPEYQNKKNLLQFHSGIAWLMQIMMFLTLGLLVYPSHLKSIIFAGLLISIFLVFVARPLSVFLSLIFSKANLQEKMFINWAGLRGAVPIILSTFPMLANVPKAKIIFDLVFFVVIVSVLVQGSTIPFVARLLKVEKSSAL